MTESESVALPLGDTPILDCFAILAEFSCFFKHFYMLFKIFLRNRADHPSALFSSFPCSRFCRTPPRAPLRPPSRFPLSFRLLMLRLLPQFGPPPFLCRRHTVSSRTENADRPSLQHAPHCIFKYNTNFDNLFKFILKYFLKNTVQMKNIAI